MKGIFDEEKIRFSHFAFVNDAMEIKYGIEVFRNVCKEKQEKLTTEKKLNSLKYLDELINTKYFYPHCYIFCLSEKKDLLSQWKGFLEGCCPVAIKFKKKKSQRFVFNNNVIFQKIIYNKKRQYILINTIIDKYLKYCETDENKLKQFIRDTKLGLLIVFAFFKSPKFSEEKEWRFVHFSWNESDDIKEEFSVKKFYLRPYKSFGIKSIFPNFENFPIIEIMLGPGFKEKITDASIKRFVKSKKINRIPITFSKIPFRTN